ncbi:MAG: sigma-70 family RNA polymerase sigma factor [Gemmatimonadaceae bacterium]|nr:sigma-70 family RNA polymerase sigma factor [Gemmatimonadaceae bacterium]
MIKRDRPDDARGERLAERMRWRTTSNAELVVAVRKGSFEALREFYARFEPLLARYAARAGVSLDSWEDDAHDVLSDVVISLISVDTSARTKPRDDVRDIHSYIQRAFRNRLLSARRTTERREQREVRATSSDAGTSERMVLATCSESAIRASCGGDAESSALPPAIARLATVLGAELSRDDREMLTWVGNAVPMREIASWLGINYSAAKVRLSRMRSRLRVRALRHVNECTGAERQELIAFFRRSAGDAGGTRYMKSEDIAAALGLRVAEPGGKHGDD